MWLSHIPNKSSSVQFQSLLLLVLSFILILLSLYSDQLFQTLIIKQPQPSVFPNGTLNRAKIMEEEDIDRMVSISWKIKFL